MDYLSEEQLERKIDKFLAKKLSNHHPSSRTVTRIGKDSPTQRFASPSIELLNRLFVGKPPTSHLT